MPSAPIEELKTLIKKLHSERQMHMNAIETIDKAFVDLGLGGHVQGQAKRGPGRPVGGGGRRTRGHFAVSGTQMILGMIKQAGSKGVAGAEIAKRWKADGRGGSSYNIINRMLAAKQIGRRKVKGERGSMYVLA